MSNHENTLKLPKIVHDIKQPKQDDDMYEYIEIEQSEDEEVSIEVDVEESSDDDFVPMASKPPQN